MQCINTHEQGLISINKPTFYKRFNFSLQAFLTIPFLMIYLFIASTTGWVFYSHEKKILQDFEDLYANEIAQRNYAFLNSYFVIPQSAIKTASQLIYSGQLDVTDDEELQRYLISLSKAYPDLSVLSFGRSNGEYFASSNNILINEYQYANATKDTNFILHTHKVKEDNSKGTLINKTYNKFIATERPWYQHAINSNETSWYPIYKHFAFDTLATGISTPIYDSSNNLLGVLASDISLAKINDYLKNNSLGMNGLVFLTDAELNMVGTSTDDPIFEFIGSDYTRVNATKSSNDVIRAAGELLEKKMTQNSRTFKVNGNEFLLATVKYEGEQGLKLYSHIVLSESAIKDSYARGIQKSLTTAFLIVVIGAVIYLLIADFMTKPVLSMMQYAQSVEQRNWSAKKPDYIPIKEINELSTTFVDVSENLKQLIDDLELRVDSRTKELQKANEKLHQLAMVDGLTGAYNRRYFDEFVEANWQSCLDNHENFSLIFCDTDQFKMYNDFYGHMMGDEVLKQLTHLLTDVIDQEQHILARYGGEEFVIALPFTNFEEANKIATAALEKITIAAIPHEKSEIAPHITISMGVVTKIPTLNYSAQQLVAEGDEQLYLAKKNGRNRIEAKQL